MANGRGYQSFLGFAEESAAAVYATAMAAANYIPFLGDGFTVDEGYIYPDASMTNSPDTFVSTPGRRTVNGSLKLHPDGASLGWFFKWAGRAQTDASYPPAPTAGSATAAAGGTLAAGVYQYRLMAVYNLTGTTQYWIGNASIAFSGTTAASNLTLTNAWTAPTPPTGYTLAYTFIFRTAAGGSNYFYLTYVSGATATYSDTGAIALSTQAMPTQVIYSHDSKGSLAAQKTFTCEVGLDGFSVQYKGCKLGDLNISIPQSGLVTVEAAAIRGQDYLNIASTSPTYTHVAPFAGHNSVCYLQPNGTADTLFVRNSQASFKLTNKIEGIESHSGSRTIRAVRESERIASGAFTCQLDDNQQFLNVLNNTVMSMRYLVWGPPVDNGVFSVTIGGNVCRMWPYQMEISLPSIDYKALDAKAANKNQLVQNVTIDRAKYDVTAGYANRYRLVNTAVSYPDAA